MVGLPTFQIDVAAPVAPTESSVSLLEVQSSGGVPIQVPAYTLEQLAGEKLRAFLSTLPAYRVKVRKPGDAVRVKDLHDLACIRRVQPIGADQEAFWRQAADEFRLACASRYIDCAGPETFRENWPATRLVYERTPIWLETCRLRKPNEPSTKSPHSSRHWAFFLCPAIALNRRSSSRRPRPPGRACGHQRRAANLHHSAVWTAISPVAATVASSISTSICKVTSWTGGKESLGRASN